MSSLFRKNIKFLKGVGEKREILFNKLGVISIGSLIYLFPRTYEDWSAPVGISEAPINEVCCMKGIVANDVAESRIRKNMTIYKFKICDSVSSIDVVFFNAPYIKKQIRRGDSVVLRGIVKIKCGYKQIAAPTVVKSERKLQIKPVYRLTAGINNNQIVNAVKQALLLLPEKVNDPIPESIRTKYDICDLKFALYNIHFPGDMTALEKARRRIAFEELLILQLGMSSYKYRNENLLKNKLRFDFTGEFLSLLPFDLTSAQRRVINECLEDMMSDTRLCPMTRLIQGDVGSGKTAVCAALSYNVIKNGGQVALMAPTEILACQHYKFFSKIFEESGFFIKSLTGSTPASEKSNVVELCKRGKVNLLIGTHALLSDNLEFDNLSLVITDEQHRFGVSQRSALNKKGISPHVLVMSATPIPRTLSLIIYGDLDISVIDELPIGRVPIETICVTSKKRSRIMNFVSSLLDKSEQGYIVCPMVEEDEGNLISVVEHYESISSEYLSKYKVAILHGKMKPKEKDLVMKRFLSREIDVLISTTVIEVGIDIPNATFIVIENAERFGLAQLHQLRGRVGRGNKKSYCILISDAKNEEAQKRLSVMAETNDGFKIADEDLKLRGPGDFLGNRQHGMPEFKSLNWGFNYNLVKQAKDAAQEILDEDPDLSLKQNKVLKAMIISKFDKMQSYLN